MPYHNSPMKRESKKPPATKNSKPREKKVSEDQLPIDTMKEGSLRKQLKLKESDPGLKPSELRALLKVEDGVEAMFRGKKVKMTPLLRKRANLGITLMKLKK